VLYDQLPRDLRHRLSIAVECDDSGRNRIAVFTRRDGRTWRFPVRTRGRISKKALWELYASV
jgi:hypothetical protein